MIQATQNCNITIVCNIDHMLPHKITTGEGKFKGNTFAIENNNILYLRSLSSDFFTVVNLNLNSGNSLPLSQYQYIFCALRQNPVMQNINLLAEHASLVPVIY